MDQTYLLLKSLHIAAVVLFLGNFVITGWWKFQAGRTRNPAIIAFAQRQVTLTDYVFTAGGAAALIATGMGSAALHGMDYMHVRWLSRGYWLFVTSGLIWVLVLIPTQIRQAQLARVFALDGRIPQRYWELERLWFVFGVLATIVPFAAIYWMVFKPV